MRQTSKPGAFTLVELLVVIAIIGILISILLPALGRVRAQGNAVACSANLRSCLQLLQAYAAENKGTMPYGFNYTSSDPTTGGPANPITGLTVGSATYWTRTTWYSSVNSMAQRDGLAGVYPDVDKLSVVPSWSKVFMCPEMAANQSLLNYNYIGYMANMVILPNKAYELSPGQPKLYNGTYNAATMGAAFNGGYNPGGTVGGAIGPAKVGQLYPDNAVLWDAPAFVATEGYFSYGSVQGGYPFTGVDFGLLLYPRAENYRYRTKGGESIYPERQGQMPIWIPTESTEGEIWSGVKWANSDQIGSLNWLTPYAPSPRFRHQKDTVCNVAFADGSVRGLKVNRKKVAYQDSNGYDVADSEFIRNYLKIKVPGGLPKNVAIYTP